MSRPEKTHNRLIHEKSPYLLQHADNPVDWHPWSDEAFRLAEKTDKPIFLSIGYSACHWCHVMAHESFEDPEAAELINDAFVPVKVDREERPDVDLVYMTVCQMMTGSGGWPLTIVMTADKRPFFAATYIPKESRFGRLGLVELIPRLKDVWINGRKKILESADRLTSELNKVNLERHGRALGEDALAETFRRLTGIFDSRNGGFGTAPKFPSPHNLLFLLRYWKRTGIPAALEMVEAALQAMRRGGICDQVGFGFHRYSTDARWLVPHFEKMLYDQAMLTIAYAEAFQATHNQTYAANAREILTYVLRDMTSDRGGFYSAEDADSEGVEGKFYLWSFAELKAHLEEDEVRLLLDLFDAREGGNFEGGQNILALKSSIEDAASAMAIPEKDLRARWENIREKLFAAREKRIHPGKDDKILTDWNGLMIAALAKAAQILDDPTYALAARRAADFVLTSLRRPDGRLLHRFRGGPGIEGTLDDYAFMVWGLLELYETIFEAWYLRTALELNKVMIDHFWDDENGGFFFTPDDGEPLPARMKEIYDGAVPSGNSVAMLNLIRLSHLTGVHTFEEFAEKIGRSFSEQISAQPAAHAMFMAALDFAGGPAHEVVLVGTSQDPDADRLVKALRSRFTPNKSVIRVRPGQESEEIFRLAEFTRSLRPIDGKPTAYVCANHACELPTTDPVKMLELLDPRPQSLWGKKT